MINNDIFDFRVKYCYSKITSKFIGLDVYVYMNEKYKNIFGSIFYDIWIKTNSYLNNEPKHILEFFFALNDNNKIKDLVSTHYKKFVDNETLDFGGKIRLSRFYKTTLYEANCDIFNTYATNNEKNFFKRLGHKLLKYVIREFLMMFINENDYVIIEASGGRNKSDMEKLDLYYRSLCFIPASFERNYLQYAYTNSHLIMYGKIRDLLN